MKKCIRFILLTLMMFTLMLPVSVCAETKELKENELITVSNQSKVAKAKYVFTPKKSGVYQLHVENLNDYDTCEHRATMFVSIYQGKRKEVCEYFDYSRHSMACEMTKGTEYVIKVESGQKYSLEMNYSELRNTKSDGYLEEIECAYGDKITLTPNVSDNKKLTYRWYYHPDRYGEKYLLYDAVDYEYTIDAASYIQPKCYYTCEAVYGDQVFSSVYKVTVHSMDSSVHKKKQTKKLSYGDMVKLDFSLTSHYGELSYSWYKVDALTGNKEVIEDAYGPVYEFQSLDTDIAGIECLVTDGFESASYVRNFNYQDLPGISRGSFRGYLETIGPFVLALVFEEGIFAEDYRYSWYQMPYNFATAKYDGEPVLLEGETEPVLKGTLSSYQERYFCLVEGDAYPVRVAFDVYTYPEEDYEMDGYSYHAYSGNEITIASSNFPHCDLPGYSWYFEKEGSEFYEYLCDTEKPELTLKDITSEDSGRYMLYGRDEVGLTSLQCRLSVMDCQYHVKGTYDYSYECPETGIYKVSCDGYHCHLNDILDETGKSVLYDREEKLYHMEAGKIYSLRIKEGFESDYIYRREYWVKYSCGVCSYDDEDCYGDDDTERVVSGGGFFDENICIEKTDATVSLSKEERKAANAFDGRTELSLLPGESILYKYKMPYDSEYCILTETTRKLRVSIYDQNGRFVTSSIGDPYNWNVRKFFTMAAGKTCYFKIENITTCGNTAKGSISLHCRYVYDKLKKWHIKSIRNTKDGVSISWNSCKTADYFLVYVSRKSKNVDTDQGNCNIDINTEKRYYSCNETYEWEMDWKLVAKLPSDRLSFVYENAKNSEWLTYMVRPVMNGFEDNGNAICWPYVKRPVIESIENTESGIRIRWNEVKNACGYIIYRSKNGSVYEEIMEVKMDKLSFLDKHADANGAVYRYKVAAKRYYNLSTAGDCVLSAQSASRSMCRLKRPEITSLKTAGRGKLKVTWKKNSKACGYQIRYAKNSAFTSSKSVKIDKNSVLSKTISSLERGKNYYVRVRSFKKENGKTYYSSWSRYVKKKTE